MKLQKGRSACLLFLGVLSFLFTKGNAQEGRDSLLKLIEQGASLPDTQRVRTLNQMGRELYSRYPDSAATYIQKAKRIAEGGGYDEGVKESLNLLGIVHYIKSEFGKAMKHWEKLLQLRREGNDPEKVADVQNNLGLLHKKLGSYKKALQAHQEALRIRDSMGDRGSYASSLNNIGIVHYEIGDLEKAEKCYQEALEIQLEMEGNEKVGGTYNNLSLIHRQRGDIDKAIEFGKKALKIDRGLGLSRRVANDLVNLGLAHKVGGHPDSAMEYYERAKKKYRSIGNKGGVVTAITNEAGINLERGEHERARELALKAFRMADSISSISKMKGAAAYVAEASAELEDPWMAYRYQKKHDRLSDSLLSQEKSKELARLQAKYEDQKRKKELQEEKAKRRKAELTSQRTLRTLFLAGGGTLALLLIIIFLIWGYREKRSKNIQLEEQKQDLQKEKEEKELLLKELNHRVKNNLQLVNSLLSLQGRRIEDEELKALHIDSQNRIRSMGLLHESIYRAGEWNNTELEEFVRELTKRLKEAYGMEDVVELHMGLEVEGLQMGHFTPIALILNELISNAMKYAFKGRDEGYIRVSLKPEGSEHFLLEVADDGVGFPSQNEDRKKGGVGLDIVDSLSEQLGGELQRPETGGEETCFRIRFPTDASRS